ncbi:MAG: hypothetical protein K6A40_05350 [Solobacterium sp.]|nr:hypothetical protein [Solobacterium sp.]
MGLGILRTVIQIIATFTLTSFLTKRYSWFDFQNFYEYLSGNRGAGISQVSPADADKLRFLRSWVIWFFIVVIVVELVISITVRIYRKKHKAEKKPISKRDHVIGEIGGGLLFMLWVILLAPLAVSLEKTEVFSNGSDLINKTVIPVNFLAKPVTRLILPDSPVSRVWDEGIEEAAQGLYDVDAWLEENRHDVKVIADLTGIMYYTNPYSEPQNH